MAIPGLGFRTVFSVLAEISLHLVQPLVSSSLLVAITPGPQTVNVANTNFMFSGAGIVIDPGTTNAELVIPSAVTTTTITANFLNPHAINAPIVGVTFPIQINTDPIFTVPEVLSYLSRAQNEFLARVPSFYILLMQAVGVNQITQTTPCTPIAIVRVACSSSATPITSLTRTANLVTVVTAAPHGLSVGSKFAILNTPAPLTPLSDPSFAGAFLVGNVINSTSFTYTQFAANSSSTGGQVGLLKRLYEATQEAISQLNPQWRVEQGVPGKWFEDRVASYQWGVNRLPNSNFPVELLLTIRDTDLLGQMDGFLVPDLVVHLIKYKALQYCWDKDGEQRNPKLSQYCGMRFDRGVLAAERWVGQVLASPVSMGQIEATKSRAREARRV